MKKHLVFLIEVCFVCLSLSGQIKINDSLFVVLKNAKEDTAKINALNALAYEFRTDKPDTAIYLAKQALAISETFDYKIGLADAYVGIGTAEISLGKYEEALRQLTSAKNIYERLLLADAKRSLKVKKKLARTYNNIGNVYINEGNYPKALENYFASLKIKEEIGDKNGIAISYGNIGAVYYYQGNYSKALENNFAALKIRKEIGDKSGIGSSYNNIGNIYGIQRNYPKALDNFLACSKVMEEIGDKNGIATSYNSIGAIYRVKGNYLQALKNNFAALKINEELGDKRGIAFSYIGIGAVNSELKHIPLAKEYLNKALQLSKEIGSKEDIKMSYKGLTEADSIAGDYKQAFRDYKQYIVYRDSLFNEENTKKTIQSQMQYDFDKKETIAKAEQDKKDLANAEHAKQQRYITFSVVGGLILVVMFSFFLYRRFKITQKQNVIIHQQKQEVEKQRELADSRRIIAEEQRHIIEKQKHLVEEHQKEIVDSITYAKRLQQAILPSFNEIQRNIPNSFVLYLPKDIVAGDFYWMHTSADTVLIAAADCTGHGVPGALVSVVCSNALNRTVKEFGLTDTGRILDKVSELVLETFEKSGEEIKDGMDISLLSINKKTSQVQWSGANNPLWIIKGNELTEIKADKKPVGKSENSNPFTSHNFTLTIGETFYLITDGYSDQFGVENKKLMKKRFKEILLSVQDKSMSEQRTFLEEYYAKWKGKMEQTDDVTVIGIRI